MKRKIFLLLCSLALCAHGLAAQETPAQPSAPPTRASAQDEVYRIAEIEYRIKGLLQRSVLAKFLGIETGMEFSSLQALENFCAAKTRRFGALDKIFDKDCSVAYELAGEGVPVPVRLVVKVSTFTTMLIIPLPNYTESDGFSLSLRYKDINFAGLMEPAEFKLAYYFRDIRLYAEAAFNFSPTFLKARWNLAGSANMSWQIVKPGEVAEADWRPFKPNGSLSLTTRYPFRVAGFSCFADPLLSYQYEDKYSRHTIKEGFAAGFYFDAWMSFSLSGSLHFRQLLQPENYFALDQTLALAGWRSVATVPYFGPLSIWLSVGAYSELNMATGLYTDAGPTTSTGLRFGKVEQRGNMRRGGNFSLSTSFKMHALKPLEDTGFFDFSLDFSGTGFYDFNQVVGLSARLSSQWAAAWTLIGNASSTDWEGYVRGVKNSIKGDIGGVLNLELPINMAQGDFFGFEKAKSEVFLVPFVDLGYVRTSPQDPKPFLDDMLLGAGMDLVLFPARAPAFTYRLSIGYDFMDFIRTRDIKKSSLEIWLGLGLFY